MEISFGTKKLQVLCNCKKQSTKQLGSDNAKQLFKRLTQLKAVSKLGDFKYDKPHPLQGERKKEFAVTICAGIRLTFEAQIDELKMHENIEWAEVKKIKIVYIGDYHE